MEQSKTELPKIAIEYVDFVICKMRYRRKIRLEVRGELLGHFEDALAGCTNEQDRLKRAEELIREFGDAKLLGKLMRRAKKRCRPLWRTMLVRMFQAVGIILLFCLIRVGYMATARPVISVDYTQWLNEKVRADRDESLNAYNDYQKAIELLSKEFPPDIDKIYKYTRYQEKTPADWQAIEAFLKTDSNAIEAFRLGASKLYYWNTYKSPKTSSKPGEFAAGVVSNLMPQCSGYRKIAQRMAMFQIPLDIHQENIKQAVDDSIALYRLGQHISSQGVVIEQLVGIAIEAVAIDVIMNLTGQVELSVADLIRLQQLIEADYDPNIAIMDWSLERAFWYDQIQRSFTDDGKGGGRPMPIGTIMAANDYVDFFKGFVAGFPDRKEVTSRIDKYFEEFAAYRSKMPYEIHLSEKNKDQNDFLLVGKPTIQAVAPLIEAIRPAAQKAINTSWRVRTGQAGLIATLSVLRFLKENGRLPENLEEVKEKGYLLKMPRDPFSDAPLMYRKTNDGFTLYSVGYNFTDDGGILGKDIKGKPTLWNEKEGDAVFWPMLKE